MLRSFFRQLLISCLILLAAGLASAEESKVLVIYRENPPSMLLGNHLPRSVVQKMLLEHTRRLQKEVFSGPSFQTAEFKTLWLVNGSVARLSETQIRALRLDPRVRSVRLLNRPVRLIEDEAQLSLRNPTYGLQKINIPQVRTQFPGVLGTNVKVGIIDTGLDPEHPDLRGKMLKFKDFTPAKSTVASDGHGHGTHVAGTIAGGETSGRAIGVAPEAQLLIGRAFDSRGSSSEESLLSSLQWMADPDENPATADQPDLVSNSWEAGGIDEIDPEEDPFCVALANWRRLGIIPVFAAGNSGPRPRTVGVPGACPEAVTVGATDQSDRIASFSSRGPVQWKSAAILKPNISAPGVDIYSANPGGGFRTRSGTSMATPHIAGVLALLIQARPEASMDELLRVLYEGSKDLGSSGPDTTFGAGRVDALESLKLLTSGPT